MFDKVFKVLQRFGQYQQAGTTYNMNWVWLHVLTLFLFPFNLTCMLYILATFSYLESRILRHFIVLLYCFFLLKVNLKPILTTVLLKLKTLKAWMSIWKSPLDYLIHHASLCFVHFRYDIMSKCWLKDPIHRPTFQELWNDLQLMLDDRKVCIFPLLKKECIMMRSVLWLIAVKTPDTSLKCNWSFLIILPNVRGSFRKLSITVFYRNHVGI